MIPELARIKKILQSDLRKSSTYREMFLQEVKLPVN
jgi:hypothetical protein